MYLERYVGVIVDGRIVVRRIDWCFLVLLLWRVFLLRLGLLLWRCGCQHDLAKRSCLHLQLPNADEPILLTASYSGERRRQSVEGRQPNSAKKHPDLHRIPLHRSLDPIPHFTFHEAKYQIHHTPNKLHQSRTHLVRSVSSGLSTEV